MTYLTHTKMRQLDRTIKRIHTALRYTSSSEFDAFYVRGLSGIVPGAIIAHTMRKPLGILRKDGEECHGTQYEGPELRHNRYIIIDDFISTGDTLDAMVNHMNDGGHRIVVCLPQSIILYNEELNEIEPEDVYIVVHGHRARLVRTRKYLYQLEETNEPGKTQDEAQDQAEELPEVAG